MTSLPKIVVYTSIFGNRDLVSKLPMWLHPTVPFYCFTNQHFFEKDSYPQITFIRSPKPSLTDVKSSKFYKHNPHIFFPNYDYSVWLDGNMILKAQTIENLESIVEASLEHTNLAALKHEHRDCSYEEGLVCKKLNLDDSTTIKDQLFYYYKVVPTHVGLISAGFLIRRHNEPSMIEFESIWWDQILRFSHRDQISFGYAIHKTALPYTLLPGTLDNNEYFIRMPHNA